MPEPQIYNAADEALKASTAFLKDYVPAPERIEERDAIWNFEQVPNALQEQTDLRAWMQKSKDARMDLVKKWTSELSRRKDEDPTALSFRRKKIRRRLLFVIGTECEAPLGSREVAAEAFKAIFPKE
jgi:hypothetical protein